MPLFMEEDETLNPVDIGFLRGVEIVLQPDRLAYTIQKFCPGFCIQLDSPSLLEAHSKMM
jgi:hypothetical protein